MEKYKLIGPITQLLSMDSIPLKGALKDSELPIIKNAGILIEEGHIHSIGDFDTIKRIAFELNAEIIELQSDYICLPGFIDVHTHICFSGSRANDYAMRNAGKTYLEIAEAGGGIWDTVTKTRAASQEELCHSVIKRANSLLKNGITTVEVKSGYGLSVEEELKMLRAISQANTNTESDLIATCLAAHMLPRDYNGDHETYLNEIASKLFPILKTENLSNRIDAFVEQSAFSKEQIEPYFRRAIEMGFDITVHADQFTTDGSEIAVKVGAISADHLEASKEEEILKLATSNTIAVALPGASIGLGCDFTPARKILDKGGALAIASDWNPGSAPMGDLLTQACILGTFQKLSNAEVLAGITYRAAAALKLEDRGKLAPKMLADFCLFSSNHYNEILYHQGKITPSQVWKHGEIVYSK
ncbi:imidazolonepropionase [Aquimarina litoralis]|uniref:imidazolonepropionase n=1 Tax=Aquimarina litoralis TaxID=584605 RepID=UPI001C56C292|nr:imidazolonepropionase [Aquimarina litoralis]MBW1296128.1 imidazolonepropionase [Aquimarina litoralis]